MSKFIPNSFQLPNALVDDLICELSANALKCYLVIVRKTVGWNKEKDSISTTQLSKITGIKKNETIYKATQELEEKDLISTIKAKGKITEYSLKVLPKKGTTLNGSSTDERNEVPPKMGSGSTTEKGGTTKDTIKTTIQTNKKETKKEEVKSLDYKSLDLFNQLTNEEQELYSEYYELRNTMKVKTSLSVHKRLLKKYFEFGRNVSVIENAINANWKDFYAPNQNNFNKQSAQTQNTMSKVDEYYESKRRINENIIDGEVS